MRRPNRPVIPEVVAVEEEVFELLDPGSSMGGARGDRWSNASVEGGMLRLAARCGLVLPSACGQNPTLVRAATCRQAELFRRMVFNALISNTDDHPRNHALLAPGREWRLSLAYDLTPSAVRSLERRDLAMTVGTLGRLASRQNLISAAPRFGLDVGEANTVIDEMKAVVGERWRTEIEALKGSEKDCEAVRGAFLYPYPGFEIERGK